VFLFVLGCDLPEQPKMVTITNAPVFQPSSPKDIHSVEQALAAIITVCRLDPGLLVVDPLHVYLYKNSLSFQIGIRGALSLPINIGNVAAVANANTIYVDLGKAGSNESASKMWLLAHEYGHNVQAAISESEFRGDVWFGEGLAEWIAAHVFHKLGWQDYSLSLDRVAREVSHLRDLEDNLNLLQTRDAWARINRSPQGRVRTYSLAHLAVDKLIRKKGLATAFLYTKTADFERSFEWRWKDFVIEFERYISTIPRLEPSVPLTPKAQWRINDQWTYSVKHIGKVFQVEKRFVREDIYLGLPSYVIKAGQEEHLFDKETLGLLTKRNREGIVYRVSNSVQSVIWPLENGKSWRALYAVDTLGLDSVRFVDRMMFVTGSEEIKTPFGVVKTIKIEAYGRERGRLRAEYWYYPDAKWFAKSREYDPNEGLIEEELVSFKVN
jgi:hypothetical protein